MTGVQTCALPICFPVTIALSNFQQKDRERIATENARLQKEIQSLTEEKLPLSLEVRKAESELGPIKYVADVVYGTQDKDLIDKAVRLIIFVIIVVFDPLAVLLLIAANQTYRKQKKTKKPTKVIDVPAPASVESFIDKKTQMVPKDKILNMTNGTSLASKREHL